MEKIPLKKWRINSIKKSIRAGTYLESLARMLEAVAGEFTKPNPEKKFIARLAQLSNDLLYVRDDCEITPKNANGRFFQIEKSKNFSS